MDVEELRQRMKLTVAVCDVVESEKVREWLYDAGFRPHGPLISALRSDTLHTVLGWAISYRPPNFVALPTTGGEVIPASLTAPAPQPRPAVSGDDIGFMVLQPIHVDDDVRRAEMDTFGLGSTIGMLWDLVSTEATLDHSFAAPNGVLISARILTR